MSKLFAKYDNMFDMTNAYDIGYSLMAKITDSQDSLKAKIFRLQDMPKNLTANTANRAEDIAGRSFPVKVVTLCFNVWHTKKRPTLMLTGFQYSQYAQKHQIVNAKEFQNSLNLVRSGFKQTWRTVKHTRIESRINDLKIDLSGTREEESNIKNKIKRAKKQLN